MMNKTYDLTEPPGSSATDSPTGTTTLPGASNKQLDFLRRLCDDREIPAEARKALVERIANQQMLNDDHGDCTPPLAVNGLVKRRASEFISRLLERPKALRQAGQVTTRDIIGEHHYKSPSSDDLPAGHYAIKNAEGQLRFYHLWRGDRNPNFVKMYVEHGPNDSEIPFASFEFKAIIKSIAEDPAAAARLYGRHIGACSRCAKRLTNRISRLLDIGPVCGGHFYDEEIWKAMKRNARQALRDAGLDPDADVEDTDDLDRIRDAASL